MFRSRWILAYSLVFGVLTLAVSYFGLAVIEFTGFQSFQRTAFSLLNLVLYIVPLAAMLMTVQSFRPEGGMTAQVLAEPISVSELVVGKLCGLSAGHGVATLFGFSFTGLLIGSKVGAEGVQSYCALVGFTILLGIEFLAIGALTVSLCGREVRSYAVVLVVWFVSTILFDLLIIGLSLLLPEAWANRTSLAAVFLNPTDTVRIATLLATAGREMFGSAGAQLVRELGGIAKSVIMLTLVMLLWTIVLSSVSIWSLKRQDF